MKSYGALRIIATVNAIVGWLAVAAAALLLTAAIGLGHSVPFIPGFGIFGAAYCAVVGVVFLAFAQIINLAIDVAHNVAEIASSVRASGSETSPRTPR